MNLIFDNLVTSVFELSGGLDGGFETLVFVSSLPCYKGMWTASIYLGNACLRL